MNNGSHPIGLLLLEDLLHHAGPDRQEIHFIRRGVAFAEVLGSLHGRNVGVDEHHEDTFLFQGLNRLVFQVTINRLYNQKVYNNQMILAETTIIPKFKA